jgi:hypothetical protein
MELWVAKEQPSPDEALTGRLKQMEREVEILTLKNQELERYNADLEGELQEARNHKTKPPTCWSLFGGGGNGGGSSR